MSQSIILRSEWDGVVELVFNRPEKLNALTSEMFGAVREAVDDLRERSDLRVMLIRAVGRYFSAGVDLTRVKRPDIQGSPMEARRWLRTGHSGMQALYEEMEKVEKPIVVAHHAMCVGGGLEMSLSCDFRLAAKGAGYWFPEMQSAMLPLSGGISRLTRTCGAHWANWMVLANEKVSADEALTMGLVHKVYPDETFEEDVKAFCRKLVSFPAEVLAAGKLAVALARDLPSDQARQLERLSYSSLQGWPGRAEIAQNFIKRLRGE